jgi:light-regulated signal transduction histidine kinase (bacteriophytochrome)
MVIGAAPGPEIARLESAVLGVLLSADTMRTGAMQLLAALAPVFEDIPCAIGARDRDGLTLHVLAERGGPRAWPAVLEPQFALGSQPGVDAASGAYVAPLRARGRVVGAIMLGEPPRAAALLQSEELRTLLTTAASVLYALMSRADTELQRRHLTARSIDAISDGVAHDLTNPLSNASALAELLMDQSSDEGERAAISRIRQELARALDVVADLQAFHRDTHAQDGLLDLTAVVERVVRFRGYAIRDRGIALDVATGGAYLPVRAEIVALEHALHVVLEHAERQSHGRVNRRISVQVVERDGDVVVFVTDSGVGNAPDLTPTSFDLPLASPRTSRDSGAVAPDLGFVASTLRGFGGRLDVLASKTEGTTLALVLPRAYTQSKPTRRNSA